MTTARSVHEVRAETAVTIFAGLAAAAGFTDVDAEAIEMPRHILDGFGKARLRGRRVDETMRLDPVYVKIRTSEGTFGVLLRDHPTLDLTGTGVDLTGFTPDDDGPGGPFVRMTENDALNDTLTRLLTLLQAQRSR